MKDEIKEILDTKLYFDLDEEDYIKIKDYITNLQQENETLHENNQNMQEEMARVWEENERLKEENVYCNRTDCVGRIKDSRKYDSVYQEKEDYKSRCEKALKDIDLLLNGTYSKQSGEAVMAYMKSDCCNLRLEIIKQDLQNGSDDNE